MMKARVEVVTAVERRRRWKQLEKEQLVAASTSASAKFNGAEPLRVSARIVVANGPRPARMSKPLKGLDAATTATTPTQSRGPHPTG